MLEEIPLKFSWKFNLSEQGEPKKFESYGQLCWLIEQAY
jgi:hypothetical protein